MAQNKAIALSGSDKPRRTLAPGAHEGPYTWERLVTAEPRLELLERQVRGIVAEQRRKRDRHFCANAAWYGWRKPWIGIKPALRRLVGWERQRGPDFLCTPWAYTVAYRHLYDQMPACQECGCMRSGGW